MGEGALRSAYLAQHAFNSVPGPLGEDREFVRSSRLPGDQSQVKISLSPRNSPPWPGLEGGGGFSLTGA